MWKCLEASTPSELIHEIERLEKKHIIEEYSFAVDRFRYCLLVKLEEVQE